MSATPDSAVLASDLRQTMTRLLRRLRVTHGFPLPQASVLHKLDRKPQQSIGELAASEGIRPQSMAQTVNDLESLGLVQRSPDPNDGRRVQLTLTTAGTEALETERRERDDWLVQVIDDSFDDEDRAALARVLPALQRIADS